MEQCKRCPFKEGCYKEGSKSKTYSVTFKSEEHSEQIAFQETEYFKEKSKERYKIEAKNSELKHGHGYDWYGITRCDDDIRRELKADIEVNRLKT